MTKIRNTKKGMAKKTLSISLAVAMLATSNVPVWAAEDLFTDGAAIEFTSEVEAPVEVVEEAPVVEETVEVPVAQDANHGLTTNLKLEEKGNGWAGDLGLESDVEVKDKNGNKVSYNWIARRDGEAFLSGTGDIKAGVFGLPLTHADYNHVYDIVLEVVMSENEEPVYLYSNKVTVSPVDIDKIAKENNNYLDFSGYDYYDKAYTGNEIKLVPNNWDNSWIVKVGNKETLTKDNFLLTYSGDTKNYTDKNIVVTGTVKIPGTNQEDPAYVGGITGSYKIMQRAISGSELTATLKNPDYVYEYCDDLATFTADELSVKITEPTFQAVLNDEVEDITYAVKKAIAAGKTGLANGTQHIYVTLDTDKLSNFAWVGDSNVITAYNAFKISKRDLSKVTASVNRAYSIDELRKGALSRLKPSDLTFKDANGKNIKLGAESITIELDENYINYKTSGAGTYAKAIKVTGNTAYCDKGPITADLTIVQNGLANGKFENTYVNETEKFAGEGVAVTKDTEKLGNFVIKAEDDPTDKGYYLTEGVHYVIEYANNTHASTEATGKAQLIVKGIGQFAGSEAVFEYAIDQAPIIDVATDKVELVYNPEYTSAADYLNDLTLTVTADNESTAAITTDRFTLKDSEYVVANLKALKGIKNELSKDAKESFTFEVNVKAVSDESGKPAGNYKDKTAAGVTTKTITVCKKSLSSEDVKVTVSPDSYVYTGTQIVPKKIIVTDGDTVLEEGTDYKVVTNIHSNDAVNVGTAKVTVEALPEGRYNPGSKATGTFTITPAKLEDVKVTYAGAEYTGLSHKDATKVSVKLGDIDVTKDFTISFPYTSAANINAGKEAGTLTVTTKTNNYDTKTRTVNFEIKPATLTGGTIKVLDSIGRDVNIETADITYDGSAHTFSGEKYTNTVEAPKKLTANDYEIIYADNTYGKLWKHDGVSVRYGAVLVVAKGNYVGKYTNAVNGFVTDGVYTDATGKKIENVVAARWFPIKQVELSASKISVENGVYAGGYNVKPNVTVKYDGKTLVEGKDYKLDLSGNANMVDTTTEKTLVVKVEPINGYTFKDAENKYVFHWGIDKFDLANANIEVSGTDAAPVIRVMNGSVVVGAENYTVEVAEGKVTVTATKDNKNYTGSKTEDIKHALEKPEAPMIARVDVVGNKATVILSGESEDAIGYDYVIGAKDCIETKDYVKVNKNKLTTDTTFTYTQQGEYYAYCHAWRRDENGKKVFSDWSNGMPFMVSAVTPDTPVITGYKVSGNTVTVTYTKAKNATGYDVVLGSEYATIADEKRPVKYGELVKKNIKGNTVTATFKNVQPGTYYAGLHAFNRTSEDGKKVFSPWSNIKTIKVK